MNSIDKTRQDNVAQNQNYCQVVVLGNMDNTIDHTFESANRVYDKNNLCPTIPTCAGGGIQPKIIEETKCCVAMRGRNPDNPSDRTRGAKMEQRLEMNKDGLVNTLTTVQKDNLVMEKEKINKVGQISNEGSLCGPVVSSEGLSPTLTAGTHGYANPHVCNTYRIRKLTPRECWRLMGYTDTDFDKAAAVNSNTQLYKEAGNAIVKQVLMAIFSQMNIKGVKPWNDMTSEEKYNLIRKSTSGKKSKNS